jgi:hypothetical protein
MLGHEEKATFIQKDILRRAEYQDDQEENEEEDREATTVADFKDKK